MKRLAQVLAAIGLVLVGMSVQHSPAQGQGLGLGLTCDLQEYRVLSSQELFPGRRVTWVGRPYLVCPDGTRIRADSAVVYEETGRSEFIGGVHLENPQRELRASHADYFEREGRLHARGAVELRSRTDGSEILGDTVVLLEAGALRSSDELTVTGMRPSATFPGPAGDAGPVTYRVVGNRLRFDGDRYLWADGDARVEHDELEASSDSLHFDREAGTLLLNYDAHLTHDGTEVEGNRVQVQLDGSALRTVTARESARLRSEDFQIHGEEIRIYFEGNEVGRLVAVQRPPDANGEGDAPAPRARIESDDFLLLADSLEVQSPQGILEFVFADGRARAETYGEARRTSDLPPALEVSPEGVDPELGEGDAEEPVTDPEVIPGDAPLPRNDQEPDWVEGDDILASFELVDGLTANGDGDDVRREYRLSRLVASGSARTFYRSAPETQAETGADAPPVVGRDRWAISYVLADEIAVHLEAGQVDRIEAEGNVRGVQLEPVAGAGAPPNIAEEEGQGGGDLP